jgi:hypothetical protein
MIKRLPQFSHAVALVALILPLSARAATPPTHVRGTVSSLSASSVTVATNAGPVAVGTANVATSGAARALEVVVFPDSMRGVGEGDYPWDLSPGGGHSSMTNGTVRPHAGSSMTNATVKRVSSTGVLTIIVAYKGGTKEIAIPPNVPIVRLEPGTASLLAKGTHVFVVAIPHGVALGAAFVVVGQHGAVPPM